MLAKKWTFLLVMVILCLLIMTPAAVTAQETSHVRFAHFVFNGPAVNIFVDKTVYTGEDGQAVALVALDLSRSYLDLAAAESHTFTIVEAGKTVDDALFKAEEFTLEAGHHYTLAIVGNLEPKDLHYMLFDETATLAKFDTKINAVSFVFNNLYGLPAVDFYWGGKLIIDNLAYGDYVAVQDPTEGKGSYLTPHGDATTKLFDYTDAIAGPPQTLAYFGFAGKYPGVLWEDYGTPYVGNFIGTPVVKDGGAIKLGDSIKVNLDTAGLRYDYTLVLDNDTTLDIALSGGAPDANTDAFLRVMDDKGTVLIENDDFNHAVTSRDAGAKALKLTKGTYILEAASYFDTFLGEYTLTVSAAK